MAATAVIGARMACVGWTGVAWLLLVTSTLLWLVLLPLVLWHWQVPTVGASFLTCVATEGLAVLAGTQGAAAGSRPVVAAGFAAFLLGLILYAVAVAGYAVLLWSELRWPRWRYDVRRWATVFPMGMTAAASFARRPGRTAAGTGRARTRPAVAGPGRLGAHAGGGAWRLRRPRERRSAAP